MEFRKKIATLMILAAIQFPCAGYAAEEDRELALIAAEQEKSGDDEELNDINPALTESISTKRTQETDKEIKERKKKLKQTRKEKEKDNERKIEESRRRNDTRPKKDKQPKDEETIIIDPSSPTIIEPKPPEVPITPPTVEPEQPTYEPNYETIYEPPSSPQPTETVNIPDQKTIYSNFTEVARAVQFIPLYIPKKSGYEITALYAQNGIVEVQYGRRWEPTISLSIRTHKRADGEELRDISGVTGVKWRVDNTTGTTIYLAKLSETQQVAAWAVGHYTFSAQAENLSFAGFHSLIADELVELSTHYYFDL
ncbi:MAG: hypothetical protein IKT98_09560 [Selenomonadaceae bacterium]|nr:hypothetical protein [Selenomonadaceae bacterium]